MRNIGRDKVLFVWSVNNTISGYALSSKTAQYQLSNHDSNYKKVEQELFSTGGEINVTNIHISPIFGKYDSEYDSAYIAISDSGNNLYCQEIIIINSKIKLMGNLTIKEGITPELFSQYSTKYLCNLLSVESTTNAESTTAEEFSTTSEATKITTENGLMSTATTTRDTAFITATQEKTTSQETTDFHLSTAQETTTQETTTPKVTSHKTTESLPTTTLEGTRITTGETTNPVSTTAKEFISDKTAEFSTTSEAAKITTEEDLLSTTAQVVTSHRTTELTTQEFTTLENPTSEGTRITTGKTTNLPSTKAVTTEKGIVSTVTPDITSTQQTIISENASKANGLTIGISIGAVVSLLLGIGGCLLCLRAYKRSQNQNISNNLNGSCEELTVSNTSSNPQELSLDGIKVESTLNYGSTTSVV